MTGLDARAGMRVAEAKQVFNLPNNLTYGRLVAVPVVAALLLWGGNGARWLALLLFIVAAITVAGRGGPDSSGVLRVLTAARTTEGRATGVAARSETEIPLCTSVTLPTGLG